MFVPFVWCLAWAPLLTGGSLLAFWELHQNWNISSGIPVNIVDSGLWRRYQGERKKLCEPNEECVLAFSGSCAGSPCSCVYIQHENACLPTVRLNGLCMYHDQCRDYDKASQCVGHCICYSNYELSTENGGLKCEKTRRVSTKHEEVVITVIISLGCFGAAIILLMAALIIRRILYLRRYQQESVLTDVVDVFNVSEEFRGMAKPPTYAESERAVYGVPPPDYPGGCVVPIPLQVPPGPSSPPYSSSPRRAPGCAPRQRGGTDRLESVASTGPEHNRIWGQTPRGMSEPSLSEEVGVLAPSPGRCLLSLEETSGDHGPEPHSSQINSISRTPRQVTPNESVSEGRGKLSDSQNDTSTSRSSSFASENSLILEQRPLVTETRGNDNPGFVP